MSKPRNYFRDMTSGLYNVYIDRTALYDPEDEMFYDKPYLLSNTGEMVEIKNDIVCMPINIVTMIGINKKNYPITLEKPEYVKEILDIVYGHITSCLELQKRDIFDTLPVEEEDLIDMENFMVSVLESCGDIVAEEYLRYNKKKRREVGLVSRYSGYKEVAKEVDPNSIRRVSKVSVTDLNYEELLNNF